MAVKIAKHTQRQRFKAMDSVISC